jgi:hypothetical protein
MAVLGIDILTSVVQKRTKVESALEFLGTETLLAAGSIPSVEAMFDHPEIKAFEGTMIEAFSRAVELLVEARL